MDKTMVKRVKADLKDAEGGRGMYLYAMDEKGERHRVIDVKAPGKGGDGDVRVKVLPSGGWVPAIFFSLTNGDYELVVESADIEETAA